MSEFWNERYKSEEFAYGTEPNEFFRENLSRFRPGKILLPAEGEGRNAVFAAGLDWEVSAFDISSEGKKKALKLADEKKVDIDYKVSDWKHVTYEPESFDVVALIFVHFHVSQRSLFHEVMQRVLKPGGIIIIEVFSKNHLNYNLINEKAGGPREPEMLYSIEEITSDFASFEILLAEEKIILLEEGTFHVGTSSVIRFIGRKV